jgi:hypothetical protein
MMNIQTTPFDVLISKICENKMAKMYINQFTGIENFTENKMVAIATLRKRNVTIAIFVQGIEQLEKNYGKSSSRTIMNNGAYHVIFGVFDLETQQYLSERIGSIAVTQRSYGEGYNNKFANPQSYRTQVPVLRNPPLPSFICFSDP